MQDKHIKDIIIAISVILVIAFTVKVYTIYNDTKKYPMHSDAVRSLDKELLEKINQIEGSIRERKEFRFTVRRDPLKQDLIVQTRLDLIKEWEERVKRMMRLNSTFSDSEGNKKAIITWNGVDNFVGIGDVLNNRRIDDILPLENKVIYTEGGVRREMTVQPIPPKPTSLDKNNENNINW